MRRSPGASVLAGFAAAAIALGCALPAAGQALVGPGQGSSTSDPGQVVLPPVDVTDPGTGAELARKAMTKAVLGQLGKVPGAVPALVVDVATGQVLVSDGPGRPGIPASTMKLVTALSVLQSLGPDAVLRTRTVLQGPAESPTLVIVGAGDSTLNSSAATVGAPGTLAHPATTEQLAANTARSLAVRGVTRVKVAYDASLFTGPAISPDWQSGFPASGIVAPVSALMVDHGRSAPGSVSRSSDPAARAGRVFAEQLQRAGIAVSGTTKPLSAKKSAQLIAYVDSPTIGEQVERMLGTSDNDLAESLARLSARAAGLPASFSGGAKEAVAALEAAGINTEALVVRDGSGLSRRNRLTPKALADLLATAARSERSEGASDQPDSGAADPDPARVTSIFSGLPIAGATGSLRLRFDEKSEKAGRGVVRAKTGTLTGVITLAGYASRPDGRLLAFAFMADDVGAGANTARNALDRAASSTVDCDCEAPVQQ